MDGQVKIISPIPNLPTIGVNVDDLVCRFLSELQVREKSKQRYAKSLRQYLIWVDYKKLQLKDITRAEILQWKNELSDPERKPKKLSSATIGAYLAAVRIFYTWCEGHKLYPNVANHIRSPKSDAGFKKQALTPEQCTKLLGYFKNKSKRDFAFVNLMLRTGIRTIEVIRMDTADIVYKNGVRVLLVQGKGMDTKNKFVKLNDKAFVPIDEYLKTKGNNYSGAIFTSESDRNNGNRLNTKTISRIVKDGFRALGIDNHLYSAHSLRHTAATLMLRGGADMERVQHVLRHSKIDTTQGYTQTFEDERRLMDSPEDLLDDLF